MAFRILQRGHNWGRFPYGLLRALFDFPLGVLLYQLMPTAPFAMDARYAERAVSAVKSS
jgi:hypothetical protein